MSLVAFVRRPTRNTVAGRWHTPCYNRQVVEAPARFELDTSGARQVAWARLLAGVVAVVAGIWLLLLPAGWVRLFGLAALVFGVLWSRRSLRTLGEPPPRGWLELDPEGLARAEGDRTERLSWRDVDEIRLDHDRLELQLHRRGHGPLVIEPRYRGIGLDELARRMELAWTAARRRAGPGPTADAPAANND